jgi:hypothetical protein
VRMSWDDADRSYSQGVSNGVLYPENSPGVSWSGLISVKEKGDDAPSSQYVDGQKYRDKLVPSVFAGTISAFTYPDQFEPYNGVVAGLTAQHKSSFGFSYRTNSEIHLVYNAMTSPSSDKYASISESASPNAFSWDFMTLPVDIPTGKASSHIVVTLEYADPDAISALEDILYGDDDNEPSLPTPETVYELFESFTTLTITDNGDGTWTAVGPDSAITMLDSVTFQIDWPSALFIDADSYQIYSL